MAQQQKLSAKQYIKTKARSLPIDICYCNTNWKLIGMATIIVSRIHKTGTRTFGVYLVDTLERGVIDSMYHFNALQGIFEEIVEEIRENLPFEQIDYVTAHNIIFGAVAFADENGIAPCKEFKEITQYILEDDENEDIEIIEFDFGYIQESKKEQQETISNVTFQFKIQLKNISAPTVWRRIEVPSHYTFEDFHDIIQASFLWEDYHLFMFCPQGFGSHPSIGIPTEDDDLIDIDADSIPLSDVFIKEKQTYTYIYDFGDDWIHTITLEKIHNKTIDYPICTAGKGGCPPEDCGGPWGYQRLKEILANPKHPEYKETRKWLGLKKNDTFPIDECDTKLINSMLKDYFE